MKKLYIQGNVEGNIKWGFYDLYDHQKKALELIKNSKYSVISHSRQMGVSSLIVNYIADSMLYGNKKFMVISSSKDCSNRIISMIKQRLSHEPDIPVDFVKNNMSELSLENGSSVKAYASTVYAGHSYKFDHVFIDNAAFINNLEKVYSSVVYRAEKVTISSSHNYDDSFFNKCIKNFVAWSHAELHWTKHPEYSKGLYTGAASGHGSPWYDRMCELLNNDTDSIKRELDCIPIPRKKKPKKNKDTKVTVRINEDYMGKIGKKLIEKDVTISQYIRELIEKDIN